MRPHPRVIIIGAGIRRAAVCEKALRNKPVDVLLVDRQNYHLFHAAALPKLRAAC